MNRDCNLDSWYEKVNNVYVLSEDTTVDSQKTYYEMTWEDLSKVFADEKGNMIISNAEQDKVPTFGYQVAGDVYHFDDPFNPTDEEVLEGETASNPQRIAFSGELLGNDGAVIITDNSKYIAVGDVTKDIRNFTGTLVFLSKSTVVKPNDEQIIKVDGSVGYTTAETYNNLMSETKDSSTVGEYLGLTVTQISNRIFTEE